MTSEESDSSGDDAAGSPAGRDGHRKGQQGKWAGPIIVWIAAAVVLLFVLAAIWYVVSYP